MTPMCNVNTNQMVGWALSTVSCDGSTITLTYLDVNGVSQGSSLPADWHPCRPGWSSISVESIVQLTQAEYDALGSYDPNTLYIIVES